jgi:NADPH-dependent 2,4-dienoyl-CoA reductase/sulfur reductase-like enzyme
MIEQVDLVVIGAGPAGLETASTARSYGLSVIVIDEQSAPGGQIYRAIERNARTDRADALGADYGAGANIVARFRASGSGHWPGTTVWDIRREKPSGFVVTASRGGQPRQMRARRIVIATGAQERPMPIPGWTLPGVLTAGALQIALKSGASVPSGRLVLVGNGPLLWLVASQLVAAGAPPAAILDTTPANRIWQALPLLPGALQSAGQLIKGLRMIRAVKRAGVPIYRGVTDVVMRGEDTVQSVTCTYRGRRLDFAADLVGLHDGVVPSLHAALASGCTSVWDGAQQCFRPEIDRWGDTAVPGLAIAGDGGGIVGADAATVTGRLAGLQTAAALGFINDTERDRQAAPAWRELAHAKALRRFLDRLYAPCIDVAAMADDVVVCRCEEVSAGGIRTAVRLGATGPAQVKAFTRCGMGPCQSRLCGATVTALIAQVRGCSVEIVGPPRIRFPLKPVTMAEMAVAETGIGPAEIRAT